jgi:hypothetical protein
MISCNGRLQLHLQALVELVEDIGVLWHQ